MASLPVLALVSERGSRSTTFISFKYIFSSRLAVCTSLALNFPPLTSRYATSIMSGNSIGGSARRASALEIPRCSFDSAHEPCVPLLVRQPVDCARCHRTLKPRFLLFSARYLQTLETDASTPVFSFVIVFGEHAHDILGTSISCCLVPWFLILVYTVLPSKSILHHVVITHVCITGQGSSTCVLSITAFIFS